MSDGLCTANGVTRPRYFDRQVVRAEDLTLEQQFRDRQARRLNRYLHGWGVVCGFTVEAKEELVKVGAGYAITPLGDEIYMSDAVKIDDLGELVEAAGCDCGKVDCEDPDVLDPVPENGKVAVGSSIEETAASGEGSTDKRADTKSVYLIARPQSHPADPRPAMPKGCGHPGNHMHPSRDCHKVCIEVVCELAPPHLPVEENCQILQSLICAPAGQRPVLPMPPAVPDSANYVVIAELQFLRNRLLSVSPGPQRALLPVEVLQEWLRCLCLGRGVREVLVTPTEPVPGQSPVTQPPVTVTHVLTDVANIGRLRAATLEQAGIKTPHELSILPPKRLAEILSISETLAAKIINNAVLLI